MKRRTRLAIAATATAGLLLTGCGGSSDDGGGSDGGSESDSSNEALREALIDLREARDQFTLIPGEGVGADDFDADEVEEWEDWQDWEEDPDTSPTPDADSSPGADAVPDSSANIGEEIEGIWEGEDDTFFGIMAQQDTGTGFANAAWFDPVSTEECIGVLFGSPVSDWFTVLHCDEDGDKTLTAAIVQDGDDILVTWVEEGGDERDVTHTYVGPWES
ncbi:MULTISPECIES: hypothetical protein [Streptomyces]|uniref:hypothetical protein n=1 Tax=Streptomyces TaxID=1883 RepID=UPI0010304925|nr:MULTISPECIES: hypothetical protein [Streptomyces]